MMARYAFVNEKTAEESIPWVDYELRIEDCEPGFQATLRRAHRKTGRKRLER